MVLQLGGVEVEVAKGKEVVEKENHRKAMERVRRTPIETRAKDLPRQMKIEDKEVYKKPV